jgi:hypothetical protein
LLFIVTLLTDFIPPSPSSPFGYPFFGILAVCVLQTLNRFLLAVFSLVIEYRTNYICMYLSASGVELYRKKGFFTLLLVTALSVLLFFLWYSNFYLSYGSTIRRRGEVFNSLTIPIG